MIIKLISNDLDLTKIYDSFKELKLPNTKIFLNDSYALDNPLEIIVITCQNEESKGSTLSNCIIKIAIPSLNFIKIVENNLLEEELINILIEIFGYIKIKLKNIPIRDPEGNKIKIDTEVFIKNNIILNISSGIEYCKRIDSNDYLLEDVVKIYYNSEILMNILEDNNIYFRDKDDFYWINSSSLVFKNTPKFAIDVLKRHSELQELERVILCNKNQLSKHFIEFLSGNYNAIRYLVS